MGDIRNGKIAEHEKPLAYYAGATDPGTGPFCFCSYWPPLFYFRSLFLLSSFLARILSAVLNTVLSTSGKTAPKQPPAPAAAITVCLVGNVWS